ncbi:MAG: beta-N-acetylhexosaminidase [[Clostridium] fimetarium]|nr:beta-N-acetylhexosaminidase [Alistipes timonensis]MCM1406676.1 beta-N-acetylhexosaminidase [[Clostridium] fimetarium]
MTRISIARHIILSLSAIVASFDVSYAADTPVLDLVPMPRHIEWQGEYAKPSRPEPVVSVGGGVMSDPERYTLTITPDGVSITAADTRGVQWALRTLEQLKRPDGSYPLARIDDYPEFPIRGFMYDDGRNFAGVERVKGYIDQISRYKLNVFQWHLTDRPAWRIESRAYPRLNDGRFQRAGRDQGKYYTYDEIRDVIRYAGERGVTVIPEIDMPGHSEYFQTTFGVPMDSRRGMEILETCLAEFFAEIPAEMCPIIHIGSDEVRVADPDGFMRWAQDFARKHGRSVMAWDPGLVTDSTTIRQFWRDGDPGKVTYPSGVPFVDSGMGYLNYYDPLLMPAKIYFHAPCGSGRANADALGGIVCLWNDVRVADKDLVAPHSGMAGGVMAFAERYWNGGTTTDSWLGTTLPEPGSDAMKGFEAFQKRVSAIKRREPESGLGYWEPIHATPWEARLLTDSAEYTTKVYGDVIDLDAVCRGFGIEPAARVECRLTRSIEAGRDTVARYKIGFEAPARSNRISDGIAAQGSWANYGKVTINGVEIAPPVWNEPEAYRYHYNTWAKPEEELPYTNEQLYWMRDPIEIPLKKGSNRVELSIKRHFKGQRFQVGFVEAE